MTGASTGGGDPRPIGMFDSGFGGLTVARAVIDLLPDEELVYLGDTGRYPYGPRPLDQVAAFAHQITEELVERRGVKLVVVACNTAAAAALTSLQDRSRSRSSACSSPACAPSGRRRRPAGSG